jgi:alcohol dehydrogenase (NADP+)
MAANEPLVPHVIKRRGVTANDVAISIKFAGICHSDIHQARDEWGVSKNFPMVPGHEIIGTVLAVGSAVTTFSVGETVGVGVMVGSCKSCKNCGSGDENYCTGGGFVGTYNDRVSALSAVYRSPSLRKTKNEQRIR